MQQERDAAKRAAFEKGQRGRKEEPETVKRNMEEKAMINSS